MAHGHSHLVPAEKIIAKFIIGVPIAYFLVVFIYKASNANLFSTNVFKNGFLDVFLRILSETWFHWIAPLFIVVDAFLLFMLIYSTVKVWHMRGRLSITDPPSHGHSDAHGEHGPEPKRNPVILKYWTAIVQKANSGTPENLRGAVLEADALVDFYLKQAGYTGEHMADRLGQISKSNIKSLDRVWDAHRLRNEIAHTPGFVVSSKQAETALLSVRDFLKEMGAF